MRVETVRFVSEGAWCVGDLGLPDGDGPFPAVVFCAGMSLTRTVWLPAYARALNQAGFATLNFDYRGFGDSEGTPRRRLNPPAQVVDVRHALTFLETRPEIDASRLGLMGVSLGCSVAVGVAGVDERARATVAVAGPGDLGRVWRAFSGFERFREKVVAARRRFVATGEVTSISVARLLAGDPETAALLEADVVNHPAWSLDVTFESLLDLFEFAPERVAHQISPRAVLFVTPEHDPVIAGREIEHLYAASREPKELLVLPGARHVDVYKGAAFDAVRDAAVRFFSDRIG